MKTKLVHRKKLTAYKEASSIKPVPEPDYFCRVPRVQLKVISKG